MRYLVVHSVPDDAFYYFQIARNTVHGEGVTLDGEHVTNGFHPLWLAITLPLFLTEDRETAVHLALTLGSVLGAVTTILVFLIIRSLSGNSRAALVGAGVFAFHPVSITNSINGIETSVSLCTIAATLLLFIHAARKPAPRSLRDYALVSAAAALAVLARTDTILLAGMVVVWLVIGESGSHRWKMLLGSSAIGIVVMLPWLAWSQIATGSVVQDSAVAGGHLARELYFADHEDSLRGNVGHGLELTRDMLVEELPREFLVPRGTSVTSFWFLAAGSLTTIAFLPSSRRRQTLRALGLVSIPFSGLLLMLVIAAGVRWFTRAWYFAPFSLAACIGLGIVANYAEGVMDDARGWITRKAKDRDRSMRAIPFGILYTAFYAVVILFLAQAFRPSRYDGLYYQYPWQPTVLDAVDWVEANTPPGARMAAFNTGMPAYFSSHPFVNLDGVVNRDAYYALRDCRTRDYVREQQIDYVVDSELQFSITSCALSLEDDLTIDTSIGTIGTVLITRPREP